MEKPLLQLTVNGSTDSTHAEMKIRNQEIGEAILALTRIFSTQREMYKLFFQAVNFVEKNEFHQNINPLSQELQQAMLELVDEEPASVVYGPNVDPEEVKKGLLSMQSAVPKEYVEAEVNKLLGLVAQQTDLAYFADFLEMCKEVWPNVDFELIQLKPQG